MEAVEKLIGKQKQKKMKRYFYVFLAAAMLCGCTSLEENDYAAPIDNLPDLTASLDGDVDTRTYVANSKELYWHEADMISAFFGNTLNRKYLFNGKTGDNSGTFSLVADGQLGTGNALDRIYAVYPYDSEASISNSGELMLNLPAEQSYASKSFGRNSNTMVAVTESTNDTFLSFKNVCGYLTLKLWEADGDSVQKIELRGNANEKIAGAALVSMNYGDTPSLVMQQDATSVVTLNCGGGVKLGTSVADATEFWFVLPQVTFSKGITIVVTATNGETFEQTTSSKIVIERNSIQPMAALSVEFEFAEEGDSPLANIPCASNEILYQTVDGNILAPTEPYGFGAKLISNTYENGVGRLTFDGDISVVPSWAYANYDEESSHNLYSIKLPEGIVFIATGAFSYCNNLTHVTLPLTLKRIDSDVFECCVSLRKIAIPEGVETITSGLFGWCRSLTEIVIPNSVTTIENSAFAGTGFTSFVIPDSVTTLGSQVFTECESLESITIGSGIEELSCETPFVSDCPKLAAFYGHMASEDHHCIVLGDTLYAFAGAGLTHYDIPNTISVIGYSAFSNNRTLESITIPDSVVEISAYAFSNCVNLESVVIPDSVVEIGYYAFGWCKSMLSVTISKNIREIGGCVFENCSNLSSVFIRSVVVPNIDSGIFSDNFYSRIIYVPDVAVYSYKNADDWYWPEYADYIQGYDFGEDLTVDFECSIAQSYYDDTSGLVYFDFSPESSNTTYLPLAIEKSEYSKYSSAEEFVNSQIAALKESGDLSLNRGYKTIRLGPFLPGNDIVICVFGCDPTGTIFTKIKTAEFTVEGNTR